MSFMRRWFPLLAMLLVLLASPIALPQQWNREPLPGIRHRLVVDRELPRMIHAIGIEKGSQRYWAVSALAREKVYDALPSNGRATLSQMVDADAALGGINGDFFQWGNDPGGDPTGLMVRNGELLSHPTPRAAVGWGPDAFAIAPSPSWTSTLLLPTGVQRPVAALNQYSVTSGIVVVTASGGFAISKIQPATFLIVRTEPAILTPEGKLRGRIVGRVRDVERIPVPAGTMVIMATGSARETLDALPNYGVVEFDASAEGFDWNRIDNVMGGGPVLVRDGAVLPAESPNEPRHPRTMMGIDADGVVWYVVVDGRQQVSVGATMRETAQVMKDLGCVDAINLDGGGSTTMNLLGVVLNRPSGGIERTIANAVLWHGPRVRLDATPFRIDAPPSLRVGESATLKVLEADRPVAKERVVWSAQAAAWIDGDGVLTALAPGSATIRALVDGQPVSAAVRVETP
jgi:hypothetical protein